jgi:hypothetical protein
MAAPIAVTWPDPCRRGFRGPQRLHSRTAIVRDYVRQRRPGALLELTYFRTDPEFVPRTD